MEYLSGGIDIITGLMIVQDEEVTALLMKVATMNYTKKNTLELR
ncbi:MAG: hypothetical protein OXC62_08790 [Aestuariivita sp.]|nr:hypothetical protein [Aestuariivita sp.]